MPARRSISGRTARAIAESVERAIEGGCFASDEPLPTIRSLAGDLGVSPTTVSAAFALLRGAAGSSGSGAGARSW